MNRPRFGNGASLTMALGLSFGHVAMAQKLDDSLLNAASKAESSSTWNWQPTDPGTWSVWLEVDARLNEEFTGTTRNNLISVGTLGHPEWSNNTLTEAVDRMGYSGFNSAVDWQGWYAPRQVRVGASRWIAKGISVGVQAGRGYAPAYANCTRANGEDAVASWTQVRFADLLDQYLYYDDLYNGNTWQYGNLGSFSSGLMGWGIEGVVQHELAFGLGWMASLGTTVGLQAELERAAAGLVGAQNLLPSDVAGPTLTPVSVAATPKVVSAGLTYRAKATLIGVSWARQHVGGEDRNSWVAAGAEPIEPVTQARLRLGMTF